jgi:hypothetical protein
MGGEPIASELASKGGIARASALSPEQRSEIARHAVEARWRKEGKSLPQATHGSEDHPLRIGAIELPCYVLEDGRRVLVQRGMLTGLDMSQGTAGRGSGDRLAKFIAGKAIKPFVPRELSEVIISPIKFRATGGNIAYGYEATVLADICDAVLEARKKGKLNYQTVHIAERCEILVRSFARVGIIALVDEATGYEEVRDRLALQAILDRFLKKEFAAWAKRFPDEFYQQIFRLRGWKWQGMKVNRPQCVAAYTKDLVYGRLAPGILAELEIRDPIENGRRKAALHQWLTEDVGHPALAQHLYATIGLMRLSKDREWDAFMRMMNRAYPRRDDLKNYPLFKDLD